ncbi:hypothetical protein [Streptomyces sp. NPDC001315]|uniref:hypothetical protein n=1 Tax=Streptomyces sp. NPDC001315 TaxID=3364562 RepID=UPI00367BA5C9
MTSPQEWAQMASLAIGMYGAASAVWFLTVDADLADFDPRPAVSRVVESGAADRLLVAVANAKWDVCAFVLSSLRDAALTAAALLALLLPAHGGTR